MTKKDYELIAKAIRWTSQDNKEERTKTAHVLANALAQENTRFNREMFLKACGVQP